MSRFQTLGGDAEVIGQNVIAFLECINRDNVLPYLERHGLDKIDPERWYPMQDFLDVLNDMVEENPGQSMTDFVSIGMKLVDTAVFPPEIDALPLMEILKSWNDSYLLNNRGEGVGWMRAEVLGDTHVAMHCHIPYPDDYNYGVFFGVCRRWLPENSNFFVYYDEDAPRRDVHGADTTIIHIEW